MKITNTMKTTKTMKTMKIRKYTVLFLAAISMAACSDDDDGAIPDIVNEEEVITTLNVFLTPAAGGITIELSSADLDADGPNPPIVNVETLAANTIYEGVLEVLNETEDPAEDITEEVAEENDEHQFFYQAIGNADLTFAYSDMDDDGNPTGINFILTTGEAGTGDLTITLRHLLDKFAEGVANGDITNAGGDTDIQVNFPITIE